MSMTAANPTHTEGPVAKTIERQTAKMPSDWFLWAALGSVAGNSATSSVTPPRPISKMRPQNAEVGV
jgi:hypothetical protein